MKLTVKQIQNILQGMAQVSEAVKEKQLKLEVGTSFMLAIAKKKLVPVYEAYTETREGMLEEFCRKDDKGQKVKLPAQLDKFGNVIMAERWDLDAREGEWNAAVKSLLTTEHEIDRLEPVKLEQFKIKKVKGADGKEEEGDIDPDILFLLTPWLVLES